MGTLEECGQNWRLLNVIAECDGMSSTIDLFAGKYEELIGSDTTHPTDAGHEHIVEILTPACRRRG